MADLFQEDVSTEDFALPGDEERLGRARAAAETPAPAEPAAEPAAPEAPAAAEETPAEPVTAEPQAETPEQIEEKLLAGKYKTPDELERAYIELHQLHGRTSQEVGELRQAVQQLAENVNQPPQAPPVQVTSDLIEANPAYAAQMAYDQDNGPAFQAAFEAWKELDPTTAAVWAAGKQAEEREAEIRKAYDERIAKLETSFQPVADTAQATEAGKLAAARADQLPGLAEFITDTPTVSQLANEFPDEAQLILSGSPDQKVRAFEKLFLIHRGRVSDTHRVTQEQVARDTAQAAQQAREDAFVASATTVSGGTQPSREEQIGAEWDAMEAPYRDGWNV